MKLKRLISFIRLFLCDSEKQKNTSCIVLVNEYYIEWFKMSTGFNISNQKIYFNEIQELNTSTYSSNLLLLCRKNDVMHVSPSTALAHFNFVHEILYDCTTSSHFHFDDSLLNFLQFNDVPGFIGIHQWIKISPKMKVTRPKWPWMIEIHNPVILWHHPVKTTTHQCPFHPNEVTKLPNDCTISVFIYCHGLCILIFKKNMGQWHHLMKSHTKLLRIVHTFP